MNIKIEILFLFLIIFLLTLKYLRVFENYGFLKSNESFWSRGYYGGYVPRRAWIGSRPNWVYAKYYNIN